MRILLGQITCPVGQFDQQLAQLKQLYHSGVVAQADLVVTPEMAIGGYPADDLWLDDDFIAACAATLTALVDYIHSMPETTTSLLVGHPRLDEAGKRYNCASLINADGVVHTADKCCLPNHSVFDEQRYFTAGQQASVVTVANTRVAVAICEDAWSSAHVTLYKQLGAEMIVVLSASPYYVRRQAQRIQAIGQAAQGLPVISVNCVGAQDDLLFDGQSFVLNSQQQTCLQLPIFDPAQQLIDSATLNQIDTPLQTADYVEEEQLLQALSVGLVEYFKRSGLRQALVGLSGGIDSALVLWLAVDALGAERVTAIAMPSQNNVSASLADAEQLAARLNVTLLVKPIDPLMRTCIDVEPDWFDLEAVGLAYENMQSRLRGLILMAAANANNAAVLNTSNKSEILTGYSTLYGDSVGAYAVIKDVKKTEVYRLCRCINQNQAIIPERILQRPPSAELRPNQHDQESLPPYEIIDQFIADYIEQGLSRVQLIELGHDPKIIDDLLRRLRRNEFKRQQSPPGPRVSPRAFGRDWRMPIASQWY